MPFLKTMRKIISPIHSTLRLTGASIPTRATIKTLSPSQKTPPPGSLHILSSSPRLLPLPSTPTPPHRRTCTPRRGPRRRTLLLLLHPLLLANLPPFPLIRPLRIPLPRLQHQHAHQQQRHDRVARAQHLEVVLPPHDLVALDLAPVQLRAGAVLGARGDDPHAVQARLDHAEPRDRVGDVHDHGDHVEHQAAAVEEEVRLRGLVQLRQQAQQADAEDGVQDAHDQGRAVEEEFQVCFERVVVREGWGNGGPEEGVVVGEEGEEDAEEEGCCCAEGGVSLGLVWGGKEARGEDESLRGDGEEGSWDVVGRRRSGAEWSGLTADDEEGGEGEGRHCVRSLMG